MIRLDAPVLLAADVHLSAAFPERSRLFSAFLRGPARAAPSLCILGDLFDVWTGDDDNSAFADSIRGELRALSESGVRVLLLRGNRDFLLGSRFAAETGVEVLTPDSVGVEMGGKKFLLAHGDHFLDDPYYIRYRSWVRGGMFARMASALPGGWRMRIAKGMRKLSRGGKDAGKNDAGEFKFNYAAAALEMRELGCNIVAHGHFHRRADEEWTDSDGAKLSRICLPDWTGESGGGGELGGSGFVEIGVSGEWEFRN